MQPTPKGSSASLVKCQDGAMTTIGAVHAVFSFDRATHIA